MASGNTLATFLPADNEPPSSNFATLDLRNGHPVLDFDTTNQETAIFSGVMPRHYSGGNIVVYLNWMSDATSGTGGWDVTFERDADAGDDMNADSFATAQTVTAVTVPGTSGVIKQSSVTCTAGAAGTDSVAAGDTFRLRVRRDVANDNAAADNNLLSVELKEA